MPTYRVQLQKILSTSIAVEADNEYDAVEKVFDSKHMPGGICAQCSGWGREYCVDDGEWDVPSVEDLGGENPVTRIADDEEGDDFVRNVDGTQHR